MSFVEAVPAPTSGLASEPEVVISPRAAEAYAGSNAVRVRTESFEGPFDLLLHLILKDEVELYEVNLSVIVDAYLAEIERIDTCDLELATEFLLIAATLVELKCRRLLPMDDDIDLDDELGLWEERDLLLSRLLECKTFKDAAKVLDQLAALASLTAPRRVGLEDRFLDLTPDLLANVEADDLRKAFLKAVAPKPKPEVNLFHVTDVRVSVGDAIDELIDELPRLTGPVSFRSLTSGLVEKLEVIVRFLAVLELFKQGLVEIDQPVVLVPSVAPTAEEDRDRLQVEQRRVVGDLTVEWVGGDSDGALALMGADLYEG